MSLENLARIGRLEAIEPDPAQIARLLAAARRALKDAETEGLGAESRFDIAYRAVMQVAKLALQANGFRTPTSRPGHHQTMIQTLSLTLGLDQALVVELDALRKQRNAIDYSGDIVSDSVADEVIRHAAALIKLAESRWSRST